MKKGTTLVLARYSLIGIFLIWILIPMGWVVLLSTKSTIDIFAFPPRIFSRPTLEHYIHVFTKYNFDQYFLNSIIIGAGTLIVSMVVGTLGGYAFARFRFSHKEKIALLVLMSRMVPPITLVLPLYIIMMKLGLLGTYWAVIIAHTSFNLAFVCWMMRAFFEEVPVEIEESAMIDGCSRIGALIRVTLPIVSPGISASAILCLLVSWNEFLFALVLTSTRTRTLPVGIASFSGAVSVNWGASMAAATAAMIPMIVVGLIIQKYLIRGLTMGAVKG